MKNCSTRIQRQISTLAICIIFLTLIGCGMESYQAEKSHADMGLTHSDSEFEGFELESKLASNGTENDEELAFQPSERSSQTSESTPSRAAKPSVRKIIYQSQLALVVDDYESFESRLPGLVESHGGYIANNNTDRRYQNNQSGTWVIRIPVDAYSKFLDGVDTCGFVESRDENAQDVTEEYVDTQARIKTKQQLETRILKMLEERTGKLADVLQIERELARVREEIERMEGRIRFLTDRTRLATITINCREQRSYEPIAAPTLATRISSNWSNSIQSLQRVLESAVVAIVALVPWIVVMGLGFGIAYLTGNRFFRRPAQA